MGSRLTKDSEYLSMCCFLVNGYIMRMAIFLIIELLDGWVAAGFNNLGMITTKHMPQFLEKRLRKRLLLPYNLQSIAECQKF